jgi:hypothetical protein
MELFIKSDLRYQNRYCWNIEKSNNLSLVTCSAHGVFNRHEGYEVLNLINRLMQLHNLSHIKSLEKIETMLINLPFEEQTHRQVSTWIMEHWNRKILFPENRHLVRAG